MVPRERTQVRTSPQYLHFSFVLVTRLKLVGSHGFSSSHVQMASRREVLYREFTMASRREEMCAPYIQRLSPLRSCAPHTYSVSLLCVSLLACPDGESTRCVHPNAHAHITLSLAGWYQHFTLCSCAYICTGTVSILSSP